MGFLVVVVDRPTADGEPSDVVDSISGTDRFLLKCQSQIDRLEGGAGFIKILHGPFTEQGRCKTPVAIGVVGRR